MEFNSFCMLGLVKELLTEESEPKYSERNGEKVFSGSSMRMQFSLAHMNIHFTTVVHNTSV